MRVPNRISGGHGATPEDTENTIMSHFFPRNNNLSEPVTAKRHDVDQDEDLQFMLEVTRALTKCSNRSAAGPDQVPYGIWKGIMSVNHNIIPALIMDTLVWGIHPPMLKESTGVILPKHNKQDYTGCASIRLIALMQTFSKIAERVVNNRLMKMA